MKPLYELARPKELKELYLKDSLYKKLVQVSDAFEDMPHLIFYGPPGTGKTTAARLLANKILKKRTVFNYLQLNASVDRGVEVIRTQVQKFISSMSFAKIDAPDTPYKMVFLDEADALTSDAQNALRNMMETYAQTSRFILSCNNFSKIVPALVSRCLAFEFSKVDLILMEKRVLQVVEKNNLGFSLEEVKVAVQNSKGDFRIAFNNLHKDELEKDVNLQVENLVGFILKKPDFKRLIQVLKQRKNLIELHHRELIEGLIVGLCDQDGRNFLAVDRLARAQMAIQLGASSNSQLLGWLDYYYTASATS